MSSAPPPPAVENVLESAASFLLAEAARPGGVSAGAELRVSAAVGDLRGILNRRAPLDAFFKVPLDRGLLDFAGAHLWANFVHSVPNLEVLYGGARPGLGSVYRIIREAFPAEYEAAVGQHWVEGTWI